MVGEIQYSSRPMEKKGNSWVRGDLIGAGAFGKVNFAFNRDNGELCAVKSIECDEWMSSEMKAMENEVQILQCLDSPFIVKCLGSSFSVENGKSMHNVFIEYMPGGSMVDLMKKFGGHFEEPLIRNYTRSILEGIRYLHSRDIVHCDIKGRNVLVGNTGVKLADFGGARRLDGDSGVMVDSDLLNVKGTPLWMAPEVVRQVEQGPASDIWSLGCTVVEMATGKAPWSDIAGAANPFVALYHIGCTEDVPDLPSCLSEQGHDFLSKCFRRDPNLRWTAAQLLQHPFITDNFSTTIQSNKSETRLQPTSPTSAFDFPSSSSLTSSIVNLVPILRSHLCSKRCSQQQQANFFQTEEAVIKQQKQSTTTSSSSSDANFWCNLPLSPLPGQWINVRKPKTMSTASSPTVSSAARELITKSRGEEDEELGIAITQQCKDPVLEVMGDISAIASCASIELGFSSADDGDDEHHRESLEIRTEQASCSSRAASLCSDSYKRTNEKVEEDEMLRRQTMKQDSCASGRGADCRSSTSTTRPENKNLSRRSPTTSDYLENRCCSGVASAAATDLRCIHARGRPRRKTYASVRPTLRNLAPAHRKFSFRGRPKLQFQRLQVHRQLH
ncbi:unnamed protein product [Calypogeia fissa]